MGAASSAAQAAANEIETVRVLMQMISTLTLDEGRARTVLKAAPWILAYRWVD
jgi:hypothetical protein